MSKEIALEIKNVSKHFKLPVEKSNGLKQAVVNLSKGVKGYKKQQVLSDISFSVEKGDFFGIVGRNGSGKSTLLKIISQIYQPDSGEVIVNGSLVPFIELGVGFNPELTGRENVYMNGALFGFSNEEIDKMYDEIVDFAELHDHMEQKLKNYSSGMQVRLAFSMAIRANSDILVLDEILAVGDEAFQRKCFNYFAKLKKDKKTVILVTHSMDSVQQFCNKAALINKGSDFKVGTPTEIAEIYRELNNNMNGKKISSNDGKSDFAEAVVKYKNNKKQNKLIFDIDIRELKKIDDPVITFVINRDTGEMVYRWTSDERIDHKINLKKDGKFTLELQNIFPNGVFDVQLGVKSRDRSIEYAIFNRIATFELIATGKYPNVHWKPEEKVNFK